MPVSLLEHYREHFRGLPPLPAGTRQRHPGRSAAPTVLIIDDDPDVRELVTAQLSAEGYTVLTADDGPSGLKAAQAARPDVIVLDVRMPKMTGFDVCVRLRQDRSTADVPVLILSAYATAADLKVLGHTVGADGYLLKPYLRDDLVDRIRTLLAGAPSAR
ncbi:response regulator [Planosporangium flavigriseum]|uniref:Response regulatory domain-containing protein n=1 Tax=Planosporangium flavigriseum TaxID=373681 RepID=A0A8J3LMP3_9ACTN|nr:response regulator [Planosporangium flavigriseum]NJC67483.1 response regulator [Planosporangium flavigriseum]GIG75567.1 hypothetical protein Pfl04_39710 [Planosporangium flavigriseum]